MPTSYLRDYELQKKRHAAVDADPPICKGCNNPIPRPQRYSPARKYCDDRCKNLLIREKRLERQVIAETKAKLSFDPSQPLYDEIQTRRGVTYDSVLAHIPKTTIDSWLDRNITDVEFRAIYVAATGRKVTAQNLGLVRKALWNDRLTGIAAQNWEPDPAHKRLLGPTDETMRHVAKTDPDAFGIWLDELADLFVEWRDMFFLAGLGETYITRPMHRQWIRQVLETIYVGGRSLILSPPRHGKTDLLIHFCVWMICRNPNIRILWVGPNGDIAENCLGQVRDLLEGHDALREAYLPPGLTWEPQKRGGGRWAGDKFTVGTRTITLKQPTMWCAGVEGKILSIDADFIVVDDPADPDASYTQGGREKILNWFRQKLITRKMLHTGVAVISSRVHPEDLYSWLIENPNWVIHVDRAHDSSICHLDLYEEHSNDDCILFPEMNPIGHLREQCDDVGMALFEMMYLNQPRPDGTAIFDVETIRAKCLDPSRDVGVAQLPVSYRLVAGLDPAARGVQASFLWAVTMPNWEYGYDPDDPRWAGSHENYYMVDLETQQAGGIGGAEKIMREWHTRYELTDWVIEDNAYQTVFFDDPRVKSLAAELGLNLRPTHTGRNKHDPHFGVAGTARHYHEGHVHLPYATPEAKRKVDALLRQMVNFTGETRSVRANQAQSDILMASWFPFPEVFRRWQREARMQRQQIRTNERSYPDYVSRTYDTPPWGGTGYIGLNRDA